MDIATSTNEMVRSISKMPDALGANACFGPPVERDGHTLIPVARVGFGYGLGFGGGVGPQGTSENGKTRQTGEGGGGGGGGGGTSTPVAVIDISPDRIDVTPIVDTTRIVLSSLLLAGWSTFWLFQTVRTLARERRKVRRIEAKAS